jgi:D-arabinose 5-phosphate isomerase GutQ
MNHPRTTAGWPPFMSSLVETEALAVREVGQALNGEPLGTATVALAESLHELPGRIIVTGVGTSGFIARRLAHLLAASGTPAFFLHPTEALHGALGSVTQHDAVIAVSKGGRSDELNEAMSRAAARGAMTVAVTGPQDSPLSSLSSISIRLPQRDQADPGGILAMGSSLAAAAWGDALAVLLQQLNGYRWSQVLDAHPGGAVGLLDPLEER